MIPKHRKPCINIHNLLHPMPWVSKATYKHFLILCNSNPLSFYNCQVLQSTQNLMLYPKYSLHPKHRSFFNDERFRFESLDGARSRKIDKEVITVCAFKRQRLDDATTLIGWVYRKRSRGGYAKRSLPSVEGFIFLI